MEILIHFSQSVIYTFIALAVMYILKNVWDRVLPKGNIADYEIAENSNLGYGMRHAGIFIGVALTMMASFSGQSIGFWRDVLDLFMYGALSIVLLTLSVVINNKFILRGIDNNESIKDNTSIGIAEFGSIVSTSIVALGAFSGTGSMLSALVFFVLGQTMLVLLTIFYEWWTKYNVLDLIKAKNNAASIMLSAMMISLSLIIYGAIHGDFTSWVHDLEAFAISAVSGIILVVVLYNSIVDKLFLPTTTLQVEIERDNNIAAVILIGCAKIALAFIISGVVL
jgi:uncharacterized membrane protein YjfL (UPF0719 family)